jgi:flagellar motor switch/type III secretory pathway protein FliN
MTGTELARRDAQFQARANGQMETAISGVPATADLVTPWMNRIEEHPSWDVLGQLRVTMRVGVALAHFKVSDLLVLKIGQVFSSASPATEDVPLMVGQVQLGWTEFEVQEQRMALRLTRLG